MAISVSSMRGPFNIEALLSGFTHHLHGRGLIVDSRVFRVDYSDVTILRLRTRGDETLEYTLTDDELMMGGYEAARHWIKAVDRDIWERCGRYRPETATNRTATEIMTRQREVDRLMRESVSLAPFFVGVDRASNPQADERAADLFKLTAGTEAFDTLNAGKPLPITGSNGTAYTLHNRASYCVERVSDGAKLCAVVPSVPLWDHLLGIKLMVEQDEPKFLKTANVAQGMMIVGTVPNPLTWVADDYGTTA